MNQGRTFSFVVPGLLAGCLLISGCATIEDLFYSDADEIEYKKAQSLPPLEIPPDLTGSGSMPMEIPGETSATATRYSEYQQQAAGEETDGAGFRPAPQPMGVGQQREPALERTPQGVGRIVMPEAFPRAWREVGRALNVAQIEIEDRDRSRGIYFLKYADPQAGGSWLSALKFWGEDAPELSTFLLAVQEEGEGQSQVLVFDEQENLLSSEVAFEILSKIHQQLK